ncbi:MAG: A/G-specific adenine glycosylase [Clostridiales bacterium]|nr:A/G-specific adenine glycosylase [Clostridiales bacterium]
MSVKKEPGEARLASAVPLLLAWYDENARILPWRENTDPYRVWVSEIMLQQTRVEAVKPYFDRFVRELPDLKSLAAAREERLLKLWEGLGYYNRVRNMRKAAELIAERHGGRFPDDYNDILALPGIGAYTAGAVASISFGKPIPAVDGNVLRVLARLTAAHDDVADEKVKRRVTEWLRAVYPASRCGDFTQSLMELGAVVCLPNGQPKCDACPVRRLCEAYRAGTQADFPVKSKKKPRKRERKTVLLLCQGDKIAVRKREEHVLLGGLWEFPNAEGFLTEQQVAEWLLQHGIAAESVTRGEEQKHVFTHVEWAMRSYIIRCRSGRGNFTWLTKRRLTEEAALPSAFRKFYPLFRP